MKALDLFIKAESLYEKKRYGDALKKTAQGLKLSPDNVRGWLLYAKIAEMLKDTAAIDKSLRMAVKTAEFKTLPQKMQKIVWEKLAHICGNTNRLTELLYIQKQLIASAESFDERRLYFSTYLYVLQIAACYDKAKMLAENTAYNRLYDGIVPFNPPRRTASGKIKVGYLSVDYCQHPVAFFVMKLLYFHDKSNFEIYCYSGTAEPDEATEQIKGLCDKWRDISKLDSRSAAEVIYNDEIDILFDLGGHTVRNLLSVMAFKPAPIQISGIGYIGTTGLAAMDYFLTDRYCDSKEGAGDFSEKLLVLPHSHFCYTMRDDLKSVQDAPCSRSGFVTFGSFNRVEKITDEMLLLWSVILKQVANSRLVLKSSFVEDEYFLGVMKERLRRVEIALERVEFRPSSADYMENYLDIDIALDTFPCGGGTTTCDALVMGVPVITLAGSRHVSRFGYSIMKNSGLDEFIATDEVSYIEKAVALAGDRARLNEYHLSLREKVRTSPVMDGKLYAAELENAYRRLLAR